MPLARELQSQFSATAVAGIQGTVATAVTAGGTTAATATAISSTLNVVTTAGAAGAPFAGVILPASMQPGDKLEILNNTAVNVCVYPPSGGKLNANTANVPLVMAPGRMHIFKNFNGTDWGVDSY